MNGKDTGRRVSAIVVGLFIGFLMIVSRSVLCD